MILFSDWRWPLFLSVILAPFLVHRQKAAMTIIPPCHTAVLLTRNVFHLEWTIHSGSVLVLHEFRSVVLGCASHQVVAWQALLQGHDHKTILLLEHIVPDHDSIRRHSLRCSKVILVMY